MDDPKAATRQHILETAAQLLEHDGAAALSTRAVAAAAGVRAASLYALFGDKDGLLAQLAVLAFERYLDQKQTVATSGDPVQDMRRGWDAHVDFGLRHPALYLLMFGTDRPERRPPVADEAHRLLLTYLDDVARAGRLRLPPGAAAQLLQAGVTGVTLALITEPDARRDLEVSTRMRDAVIASVVVPATGPGSKPVPDPPDPGDPADAPVGPSALALDALLAARGDGTLPLRDTETALLRDWLRKLAIG